VVILRYNQETQVTLAFLLGHAVELRKAVSYGAGAQPTVLSGAKARAALQEELQYWSSRAAVP